MIFEETLGEDLMDEIVRIIFIHLYLFEDHSFFAIDVFWLEERIQDDVAEYIHCDWKMFVENLRVETDGLFASECVHVAADGVHLAGDVECAAVSRPLEDHMFHKVRDAVHFRMLMAGAGLDPYPNGHRTDVFHALSQNGETVGKDLLL